MKKKLLGIFVVTLFLVATGLTVAGTMKLNTSIILQEHGKGMITSFSAHILQLDWESMP